MLEPWEADSVGRKDLKGLVTAQYKAERTSKFLPVSGFFYHAYSTYQFRIIWVTSIKCTFRCERWWNSTELSFKQLPSPSPTSPSFPSFPFPEIPAFPVMSTVIDSPLNQAVSAPEHKSDSGQKNQNKQYGLKFVGAAISSAYPTYSTYKRRLDIMTI